MPQLRDASICRLIQNDLFVAKVFAAFLIMQEALLLQTFENAGNRWFADAEILFKITGIDLMICIGDQIAQGPPM